MATPHISAADDAFAATCLLPGDPLRAKYIADNFLTDSQCVTDVRNMLGFTGYYQGHRVSVMGTGMGMPSCTIYATELVRDYGVQRLVRVGSCGAVQEALKLNDLVIANSASTDSNLNRAKFGGFDFAACASPRLVQQFLNYTDVQRRDSVVGQVFSTDSFYDGGEGLIPMLQRMGVLAVEMEAAGLYGVASRYQAQALTVLTVSDHLLTGAQLSSEARQNNFNEMISLTLAALHPTAV